MFFCTLTAYGQDIDSNIYNAKITLEKDTSIVVANTIVPSSLIIQSAKNYIYEPLIINNILSIPFSGKKDTLNIYFRFLKLNLGQSEAMLDSSRINTNERIKPYRLESYNENSIGRLLIDSKKLEYTGSFSRGVSFGNTQDVVLNSSFNMQMRGDLGNDLYIKAAISDENIPIQPEGNTQVLQEFDKVFMEIRKDNTTIIAGDYELSRPESYFINYYKKLKGISIGNEAQINEKWKVSNKGSFAISRGKFRRQTLIVQDGNQGPYKLQGDDGELFVQVLSGTEKVFSDGKLLKRGENEDYVIDYNRGELRFTPNLIITANRRIIVEFEYAIQSYLRSLYATESKIEHKNISFGINFYNEQDSKSLSSNIQLDSIDLANLSSQGDGDVFRDGIFIPEESARENIILYNQNPDGSLVYTAEDTSMVFGAIFSNFGSENGNYIIDQEARANGRVYKYVGEGSGNYRPQIPLIAPEKKQMLSFSTHYKVSDSTYVFAETAMSNNDVNRFSKVGNDDNIGLSFLGEIGDSRYLMPKAKIKIQSKINYELTQKDFVALNPYRNAEFSRDWNIESNAIKNNQQILNASFKVSKKNQSLAYTLSRFTDRFIYKGTRHISEANTYFNGLRINAIGNWMNAENLLSNENIVFFRPRLNISQSLFNKKWRIGMNFEKERNIRTYLGQDSLNRLSFDYDDVRVFLENRASENVNFKIGVSKRFDKEILTATNELTPSTTSTNIEFGGNWNERTNSILTWNFVLRNFKIEDNFTDTKNASKTFIGTLDHKLELFNRGISLNTYYESNSGQEPKLEFQYVKVQTGEGSYIWNDYNQDSIQQITEFEISPFSDQAAFEKITVFNDEFISTNRNILNQSLKINPKNIIGNQNHFLSKWQLNSRYRIDQKKLNEGGGSLFQFVNFNLNAEGYVAFNASFDHSLFFNRGNSKFDSQISYRFINNKILQINGDDQRSNKSFYSRTRVNIKKQFDLLLETNTGSKKRSLEGSDNQNFDIPYWNLIPQINYRPSSRFRFVMKYKYEYNKNSTGILNEKAIINDGGIDLTWRQDQNSNLQLKFNYIKIDFTGENGSPIEFEMLQGLKNGQNYVWNLNYTRRLSTSIDMIVNYNGRKSEGTRLINTAGVQMRAIF